MSFTKTAIQANIELPIEFLSVPEGRQWDVLNDSLRKTASISKMQPLDIGGFDLQAAIQKNPDHLFVKVFAIKKDEVNDNGDCFSEKELKKAAPTFIGVPVFTNHQNDDVEKARGKVVHAWYDDSAGGIYIISMVDKTAYPKLARGIEQGYVNGTSMGCFPYDAKILMADGTEKNIVDIQPGDEVITHLGNPRAVINLQNHLDKTNNDLIVICAEGIEKKIESTKEHPFLVLKEQPYCRVTGDLIGIPKNRYKRFLKRTKMGAYQMEGYQTALADPDYEFEWKKAEDLVKTDVLVFPIRENDGVSVSPSFARLLGFFLAEGNFVWRKDEPVEIQFSFNINEKETLAAETYNMLISEFPNSNKPRIYVRPIRNTCEVRLASKDVASIFYEYCGSGALTKQLSRKVFDWDKNSILRLIGAWIAGDGYRRRITDKKSNKTIDNYSAYTSSSVLSQQIKYLSRLHGLRAIVFAAKSRKTTFKGRLNKSNTHPSYSISYTPCDSVELSSYVCNDKSIEKKLSCSPNLRKIDNYLLFPINKISKQFNIEPVYNIEVDEDNSFIVNGVAVHNCQVNYSLCSICHKKAHTQDEFCSHVKERKNKKFSGKMKCKFHESDCKPDEDCPICGCKKSETKENLFKEAKIFEHNFDIKFIEDSFVVNPACHDCLVCDVINTNAFQSKVASMMAVLKTAAANMEIKVSSGILEKVAGQTEIADLNEAMNKLERVARSMMAQKQKIQLEYVSDIIESLADIQATTDELIQMGYAQLPSPSEQEIAYGTQSPASPAGNQAQQTTPQSMPPPGGMSGSLPMTAPTAQPSMPQMFPSPQSGVLGNQVGTITKPSFSAAASIFEKDFVKKAYKIKDNLTKIESGLKNFKDLVNNRSELVADSNIVYQTEKGDYRVLVANREDGETHVAEYKGDLLLRVSNADVFDDETRQLLRNEPQKVAESILRQLTKESGVIMASQEKTAAGVDKGQIEITTEAQLDQNRLPIAGRTGSTPEGITESAQQLGGSEQKNDTTSNSPQVRLGTYETITEDQLASITDGYMVRWSDYPEVITEGQWDEASRAVRAVLPGDWLETIGEKQLISLRDNHSWVDPNFITERQLAEQKDVLPNDATARFAKTSDPKILLKAAMNSVADAISRYNLTPHQVSQAISRMTSNPQSQIKAARLTLLNSIPRMIEARSAECKRRNYFAKVASESVSVFNPIDGILASMADNIGYLKADDLVDAVRFVAADSKIMKKAEQDAVAKIASRKEEVEVVVDRASSLRKAFAELDGSDDGIYKICGSINEDIKVSISDRANFISAIDKFARSQVTAETVLTDIDVDAEAGTFEAVVKEASALTAEEKKAAIKLAKCPQFLKDIGKCTDDDKEKDDDKEEKEASTKTNKVASRKAAREEMVKQAQMMGGQMGGGMGGDPMGGGGQGATMPQMPGGPGGQPAPVESFTEDPAADPLDEAGENNNAKPPGAICPACGAEDVDAAGGKSHCNSCGLDFIIKVMVEALNWPGMIDDGDGEDDLTEDKGLDEEGAGEGFPMPANEEPASIPVAAMTRLHPKAMQKIASMGIKIGDISPLTGSRNTMRLAGNHFFCLDTGNKYEVALRGGKGKDEHVYAEWRWMDKRAERECASCRRQRSAFVKALSGLGVTEAQFDAAQAMDKAKIILAMQDKGLLKQIKTASKTGSIIGEFKTAFSIPDEKFPVESCREKLARRYGENAVALSGPCEGSNLADCVCNKLKTAGFYSDGLAIKLASIWSDCDGTVECWEDYIRSGLNAKQAATVCEQIRRKYSQAEHFVADDMTEFEDPMNGGPESDISDVGSDNIGDSSFDMADDPFAANEEPMDGSASMDGSTPVDQSAPSVDLPLEILDALKNLNEQVINKMEGQTGGSAVPPATDVGDSSLGDSSVHSIDNGSSVGEPPMGGAGPTAVEVEMTTSDPMNAGPVAGEAVENAVDTAIDAVEGVAADVPGTEENAGIPGESPVEELPSEGMPSGEISEEAPSEGIEETAPESEDFAPKSEEGEESESEEHEEGESEEVENKEHENGEEDILEKEGNENRYMANSKLNMVREAESLRRGRIVGNHKVNLDVSSILKVLNKKAEQSEVKLQNAQDSVGTISNGKTLGHEPKLDLADPEVPSDGAGSEMGHEENLFQKEKVTVYTGDANMGHEKEQGYTSEDTDKATGGDVGAGNSKAASSTRKIVQGLADRIVAAQKKTASDKKLDKAEPVSKDGDIAPISNNKDLSTTPEGDKITPFADSDSKQVNNVPEKGDGSFMGHEKETLNNVPKSDNAAPQFPVGGGKNPKYDTKWDAEKQTKVKGTVIANSNEKSVTARKEAATKLAGRMIERGLIKADQLMAKIAELERYESTQIADLEKAMFANVAAKPKKGLDTVPNGSERAVVIAETSKFKNGEDELKNKLQSMFKMQKLVDMADDDPNSQLRKHSR